MKKIFLVMALAFAFTTGMAAVTVITHPDQAMGLAVTVVAPTLTPADGEIAMKKILLFLALGFALFAAPAVVVYPQAAVADPPSCSGC